MVYLLIRHYHERNKLVIVLARVISVDFGWASVSVICSLFVGFLGFSFIGLGP